MSNILQNFIQNFIHDEKAAVMPIVALVLPAILGMAALGVDGSLYVKQRNNLQSAADAAALTAAWERAHKSKYVLAEDAALREAKENGFTSSEGSLEISFEENSDSDKEYVEVTIQQKGEMYFASFLSSEPAEIGANARALASQKTEGPFCLVSLNDSESGAINTHGNGRIDAPGCGIAVNSDSGSGLELKGNVDLDLNNVRLAGNYTKNGSGNFDYNDLKTDQSRLEDPFKDVTPPAPSKSCSSSDTNSPVVIDEDTTFSGDKTFCGGLTIKGDANVDFNDGNFYIYGGTLKTSGGGGNGNGNGNNDSGDASLSSNDASIILTGDSQAGYANIDITGGSSLDLDAPSEGFSMAGMAIYQDPDAPEKTSSNTNKIAGNAEITIDGVAYLPSQGLSFKGTSGVSNPDGCTRIVANTIELGGTPDLFSNCEDAAAPRFTQPHARLVN